MPASAKTVHDLRRQWKPHKERLAAIRSEHPTAIRFHRACSWMSEVEQLDPVRHADQILLHQWIAFNALYGQWDQAAWSRPPTDEAGKRFLVEYMHWTNPDNLSMCCKNTNRLFSALWKTNTSTNTSGTIRPLSPPAERAPAGTRPRVGTSKVVGSTSWSSLSPAFICFAANSPTGPPPVVAS